jgi:hypothetical protein
MTTYIKKTMNDILVSGSEEIKAACVCAGISVNVCLHTCVCVNVCACTCECVKGVGCKGGEFGNTNTTLIVCCCVVVFLPL